MAFDRKLKKRCEAIAAIQRTPAYIIVRIHCDDYELKMPDPYDLTLSKRRWERSVMEWRRELRKTFYKLSAR